MKFTPEQQVKAYDKLMEGQWKSIDKHRLAAFSRIEKQCMGPDGLLDWEKANEMKRDWDKRHGYHKRPNF